MLDISISEGYAQAPITIMHLKGSFDSEGAETFDSWVQDIASRKIADVLVDLSEVTFMSSVGIRSLHKLFYLLHPTDSKEYRKVIEEGIRQGTYKAPHLKLLNPSPQVLKSLEMVSADMYLEILSGDELEALKCFEMDKV